MKVIDFMGFDHLSAASTAGSSNRTIAGTRFRYRNQGNASYNSSSFVKFVAPDGQAWLRTSTGTITYPNYYIGAVYLLFDDAQPGLNSTNTKLTMGIRQWMRSNGNQLTTNATLSVIHENETLTTICSLADWDSLATGIIHYWEMVFDRVAGKVKLVRDNLTLKTVDLADAIAANGKVKGFAFGNAGSTAAYGNGSQVVDHRDIYLAEVEDGDVSDRLGSQVVKSLPVASVDASSWTLNVPATGLVGSLNDAHPSLTTLPSAAAMTWVGVNESDAKGEVVFSADALLPSDRVTALTMQIDALATTGASTLDASLVNGSSVENTKRLTFTQSFDWTKVPAESNFGKPMFLKQWPASSGNKAAVASYKLRLKAGS